MSFTKRKKRFYFASSEERGAPPSNPPGFCDLKVQKGEDYLLTERSKFEIPAQNLSQVTTQNRLTSRWQTDWDSEAGETYPCIIPSLKHPITLEVHSIRLGRGASLLLERFNLGM
ncbi:hypothetical protein AVEN_15814-1 [Araneus ventricosus]|uniref:Uncharacterized protein n=1 Tax=Araneus ventricosus TaxID=182803 RepID=A0A4Y2SMP6_ARAVE|nr:hypothetical protein AVEN_15814-1 [Araneus ventricosus]